MSRVHVVGGGLAGLSAAVALARAGRRVTLSEAGPQAGGRCRSYHDPQIDMLIDNGNHLVLAGNRAVADYLATIGASDRLTGPDDCRLAFVDLRDGARWLLHPNDGPIPWWVLSAKRRVPGTRARDYLALARLARGGERTIAETIATAGPLWERLLEPFLVSALNTPAREGSAGLAGAVIRETLAKGGRASAPRVATPSLAAAFVDPALAYLEEKGGEARLGRRLRALRLESDHVAALDFADGEDLLGSGEAVVLALPAWVAADLVPDLVAPDAHRAIVNAHFRVSPPPGTAPITGLVGGTAEWVFAFPDRLSVTVSAADRLCDEPREPLARRLWADVARALGIDAPLPPWQIVREKRATFAATPAQERRRPPAATRWRNLFLAGDWTATGLPATIEGALRSGRTAAALVMRDG